MMIKNCETCTNFRPTTLLRTSILSFERNRCQLSQNKQLNCKGNDYSEWQQKKY